MTLDHLLFEYNEGGDGTGLFDAMATVSPERVPLVAAEIAQVLAWADGFPGPRGPVEEGGAWDADVQVADLPGDLPLRCYSVSIGGVAAFCEAFRARFEDALY